GAARISLGGDADVGVAVDRVAVHERIARVDPQADGGERQHAVGDIVDVGIESRVQDGDVGGIAGIQVHRVHAVDKSGHPREGEAMSTSNRIESLVVGVKWTTAPKPRLTFADNTDASTWPVTTSITLRVSPVLSVVPAGVMVVAYSRPAMGMAIGSETMV